MLMVAGVMAAAVAIYAGVAIGHNGGGGNSGPGNGNGDRHGHNQGGRGDRGKAVLEATLAPSQTTDPTFHGVQPGAVPWVLKRGSVELKGRGRLELRVRGLVIPAPTGDNTPGPVMTISASLYCGADSDTTAADTTQSVPIDRNGNARIKDRSFNVPSTCLAPVILVHPNGNAAAYIAVDGWRS
jgi:hypothetical protein